MSQVLPRIPLITRPSATRRGRGNAFLQFLAGRLIRLILTVLTVSVATFFLITLLPGDPAYSILPANEVTPQAVARVNRELGLNQPLPERYWHWLWQLAHGNLGYSYVLNSSVSSQVMQHLPVTVELIALALLWSLILAIPLGIIAAYLAGRPADKGISLVNFGLVAVPGFVMALVLILIFSVHLRLLPASGWVALNQDPVQNLIHMILPSLSLALTQQAAFSRVLRSEMITTLQEEYIGMARAKGLSTVRILLAHALRPSSFSLATVVGLQIGVLISGAVIIEQIFSLPGIGSLLLNAIYSNDYPTVQGVTVFIAVAFVVINLLVDVLYRVLDPRVRLDARD